MNFRKASIFILLGGLLSLSACGNDNDDKESSSSSKATTESSKTTKSSTQESTVKEIITTGDNDSAKLTDYRQKVAKLSPEKQLQRLKVDVLPKLTTGNKKYILNMPAAVGDDGKFDKKAQGTIYEYPESDHTDWTEVAKVYVNPELNSPLSFKVLDKTKTPELYETLNNNIR